MTDGPRRLWTAAVLLILGMAARPSLAHGQNTNLTFTGSATFPTAAATDFNASPGAVYNTGYPGTGLTYLVRSTQNISRTSTLSVYATAANLGGGKPMSDLQFKIGAGGAWTPMPIGSPGATVHAMSGMVNKSQFTNTMYFRILLNWVLDVPATYTTGATGLTFQLTTTAP